MTPAARLRSAAEILDALRAGGWRGADRALAAWGRANRFAGAKDRAALADLVYDALRRRRSLGWRLGAEDPDGRALTLALAIDGAADPAAAADALFTGDRHAPSPLTPAERAALAAPPAEAPEAVALDLPDALMPALRRSLGADLPAVAEALRARAPVDLRVNVLKATPAAAAAALAEDGVATTPGPLSALCLRVTDGARRLRASRALVDGLVEIQDAASQAVAELAAAAPGETILDLCAGGGGKTLALGAAAGGRARLLAHDAAPRRMADLPARAARAGLTVERLPTPVPKELAGACDLVFVDAPCSGSGAWRRNPDAKWALAPAELDRLGAIQDALILQAAALVRPGGRMVYATCSLLAQENEDRAVPPDGFAELRRLRLTPRDGGDGFFAVLWRREAS